GIVDLDLYRDATVPQLQILLNREALARAGIPVAAANDFIATALAGKVVTTFWEGERPVPVRLLLPATARENDRAIGELAVPRSRRCSRCSTGRSSRAGRRSPSCSRCRSR